MQTDLATIEHAPVPAVADPSSPLPVFTGEQMTQALKAYKDLQRRLDEAMPDQIMTIGERQFRKKGFWRAVEVAFNLTVEPVEERREDHGTFDDGRENFGYVVTYRATAPNGRSVPGDGACFAVEKAGKFRCPHPEREGSSRTLHWPHKACPDFDPDFAWHSLPPEATEHNVRSHAHTRAFNRAVSNLVGFGEVSAEEVERDEAADARPVGNGHTAQAKTNGVKPPQRKSTGTGVISEAQRKRMWAIAKEAGWADEEIKDLLTRYGFERTDAVTRDKYDAICHELEAGTGEAHEGDGTDGDIPFGYDR